MRMQVHEDQVGEAARLFDQGAIVATSSALFEACRMESFQIDPLAGGFDFFAAAD
jgi:hypothetical protein